MGSSVDARQWEQIVEALGAIEYDERGTSGHDAYVGFARSIIKPLSERLGWDAKADDPPNVQKLRRALLSDLGAWGDQQVIAEARRRFDRFIKDHASLGPDDQAMVLSIVMRGADADTFEQVHALAKQAGDETDLQRYYSALDYARDPQLAEKVAQIALSSELPPQAAQQRVRMVIGLARDHPQLAWSTFTEHVDTLMAPFPTFAPLIIAQYVPVGFWDSLPPDQLETWVRAHVPAEMSVNVDRGMESVHFKLAEKQALVAAADQYLKAPHGLNKG
jgi:aminopeptidase N